MKIAISYFYQIRNFTKNMIPMSTCLSDPVWYHDNQGKNHIFKDKRGILNGLRLKPVIIQDKCEHICPCNNKNPNNCDFLKSYRKELDKIDFEKMYKGIENFSNRYKKENKIKDEIIIAAIVYETPTNLCSERKALIDYFRTKGIEVKEFQPNKDIKLKKGDFIF